MSKKKGRAAKRAVTKAVKRTARPAKARASRARAGSLVSNGPSLARTRCATIFVFRADGRTQIRTSPHRLYANPGDSIEWTVVNMSGEGDAPVKISWEGEGPWGKEPIEIRDWNRKRVDNSRSRRYKYTVSGFGAEEDPEIEIPEI